jgi:hypothetical protein
MVAHLLSQALLEIVELPVEVLLPLIKQQPCLLVSVPGSCDQELPMLAALFLPGLLAGLGLPFTLLCCNTSDFIRVMN